MKWLQQTSSFLLDFGIAVIYAVVFIVIILGILFFSGESAEFIYMKF